MVWVVAQSRSQSIPGLGPALLIYYPPYFRQEKTGSVGSQIDPLTELATAERLDDDGAKLLRMNDGEYVEILRMKLNRVVTRAEKVSYARDGYLAAEVASQKQSPDISRSHTVKGNGLGYNPNEGLPYSGRTLWIEAGGFLDQPMHPKKQWASTSITRTASRQDGTEGFRNNPDHLMAGRAGASVGVRSFVFPKESGSASAISQGSEPGSIELEGEERAYAKGLSATELVVEVGV
ncbi:uncharacterized protein EI90DRAFT_3010979 [Cantharellus anzutake]|uniref:uncharacterized protein n=1 Tax=Cantharellus anzutake TaxID=1750568 RepID=UPI001904C8F8|nr:uncharacterized protein EI90DRAFT_3010979 [Cantharellus anzutake]KAF8344194.1 hypothetical protein EI90DRAFT_3010979 [Cantharellus anzutake]